MPAGIAGVGIGNVWTAAQPASASHVHWLADVEPGGQIRQFATLYENWALLSGQASAWPPAHSGGGGFIAHALQKHCWPASVVPHANPPLHSTEVCARASPAPESNNHRLVGTMSVRSRRANICSYLPARPGLHSEIGSKARKLFVTMRKIVS